jgi:molybdopterin molybdotransferase
MISVKNALSIILENTQDFGVEKVSFLKSLGKVLKENIVADRDFPPFNRVAMDGICIDKTYFDQGQRSFAIENIQPAGSEQLTLQNPKNCIEVMTGSVLPKNANAVIRYEDVTIANGTATVHIDAIKDFQNIHPQGKDQLKDNILIEKNHFISAAEIAVIATVGKNEILVSKQPKVLIISTGDELVGVDETPKPHQIRRSNVFNLVALLENLKISSETKHLTDNKAELTQKIATYLKAYDVLLFSGAVSKGKFDFLPEVLDSLNVKKQFHKVAQRPGKPFWFGTNSETKTTVFAFPGNPISTFVNCLAYFYPWYKKSIGLPLVEQTAILEEDIFFKPNLDYFLQVFVSSKNGKLFAKPIKGNGSGDLVSLVNANAFIHLPNDKTNFKKGEIYPILNY